MAFLGPRDIFFMHAGWCMQKPKHNGVSNKDTDGFRELKTYRIEHGGGLCSRTTFTYGTEGVLVQESRHDD